MNALIPWGELEEEEKIDLTDQKAGEKQKYTLNSFEIPPLYEPPLSHKHSKKDLHKRHLLWMKPPLDSIGQNHLLQSVELQNYKRRIRCMLAAARSHQTDIQKVISESQALPPPPLLPKRFCSSEGQLLHSTTPTFLSTEFAVKEDKLENKLEKKVENCPYLSALSSRQLLLKSIATIMAHVGFETASESSLNTFTDVAVEHFTKFCALLKERLEHSSPDANPMDIINSVLSEASMESLSSLQNYWLRRVKQVAVKLEKENIALLEEYNVLKESSAKSSDIKEENPYV